MGLNAEREIFGNSYFGLIYSAVQHVSGDGHIESKYCPLGESCHLCVVASRFGSVCHTPHRWE